MDCIDISEQGTLDWRLRELASALVELRKAVEAQTEAQQQLAHDLGEMIGLAGRM